MVYITLFPENQLSDFAEEIKALSREDLYACVTQDDINVDIELSATLNDKTATKTYYFTLVAADIDVEIIDYLIDDSQLLNVVHYENVDDDLAIEKIAHLAKDPLNPYPIEHLVDTVIIPETITLTNFGNKQLQFETTITNFLNYYEGSVCRQGNNNTAKNWPAWCYDASGWT